MSARSHLGPLRGLGTGHHGQCPGHGFEPDVCRRAAEIPVDLHRHGALGRDVNAVEVSENGGLRQVCNRLSGEQGSSDAHHGWCAQLLEGYYIESLIQRCVLTSIQPQVAGHGPWCGVLDDGGNDAFHMLWVLVCSRAIDRHRTRPAIGSCPGLHETGDVGRWGC